MTKAVCAVAQMASSPNVEANLITAERLIEQAAAQHAQLVVLPENFALMGMADTDKLTVAEDDGSGPIQDFLARAAEKHKIWVIAGTMPIRCAPQKVRASCLIFDAQGKRVGRYDKIHLFDVDVPGSNEQYRESTTIDAGEQALVLDTPFGRLGVAICYDLRFPELFRQMLDQGLEILALPSAFTARTGAAHWDVLIRARSIENLCYTLASNQGGFHINGRETYGHSMIVDPWGKVVASITSGTGVAVGEIDLEQLRRTRLSFPALKHRRLSCS